MILDSLPASVNVPVFGMVIVPSNVVLTRSAKLVFVFFVLVTCRTK